MTSKWLIFVAITTWLFMSNVAVMGRKVRSKDVVKTIKTEHSIYDCVDFYKQPALKDPRLKNHTFHPEMRPSARPNWVKSNDISDGISIMDMKFKGETCPRGTVPIRRLNADDERRQIELRRQSYAQLGQPRTDGWSASDIKFALGQSKSDSTKIYNGIASTLSIFNPHVERYQYSSGEIIIKSGSDAIITGWTVNQMLYKDNRTHFFIYTVSGDSHCMGVTCGFIPVRADIPLDFIFDHISTVEGTKYNYPFFVYQDALNGNWWLEIGDDNTILGFWPQNFFHGLYKSASYVACGGEVYGPQQSLVYMGSGYRPSSSEPEWSYCKDVKVVNEAQHVVLDTDLEPFMSNWRHYLAAVHDSGKQHYVLYGGPEGY
ncbi:hypothetical protein RND81_06G240800 [Saponaria officinalis]|uniref:Neprosin PEP catalytic domain-containing protein n=1 Tax=Saponaria officinalis TaxID=3572 RepID=A0AAW1KF48_SAPOF